MGRTMIFVGFLAVLALGAAGVQGFLRVEGTMERGDPALQPHILLSLVAVSLALLAHGWIVIYLTATARVVRRFAAQHGRGDLVGPRLDRFGRRTVPPAVLGFLAVLATFLLGASAQAGWVGGVWHVMAFAAAVLFQLWALAVEWPALEAVERSIRDLERAVPDPSPSSGESGVR